MEKSKGIKKVVKSKVKSILAVIAVSFIVLPFQNCAKTQEFAVSETGVQTVLVYGDDPDDQELLRQKLAGVEAPTISQIFRQWSRLAGTSLYQKETDIIPNSEVARCFTQLDSNGDWMSGQTRAGNSNYFNPGIETHCMNDDSFGASSWSYLNNRLKGAVNADRYTGFLSGVPVQRYSNEAVVTSPHGDDDALGLLIAVLKDASGQTHILSAQRTHGGREPSLGWGFVYTKYSRNGLGEIETEERVYSNTTFGAISKNRNGFDDPAPYNGWSGKRTLIRVERDRSLIKAYTSLWSSTNQTLTADLSSLITLDLDDPANGLEIFKGAQKYGYGLLSQYAASFSDIKFKFIPDADKIYDLKNRKVYRLAKDGSGRYELVKGSSPKKDLGYNAYLINPETQKAFFMWYNGNFEEIAGDVAPDILGLN